MKRYAAYPIVALLLGAALLTTAGCTGTSKPATFYLLSPLPESTQKPSQIGNADMVSLMIGPVSMPAYLDRPNLVFRANENRLSVAEFNRWAEPLQDNLFRVLAENLAVLLDTVKITPYPQRISQPFDYQIIIILTRFDTNAEGDAVLTAFWLLAEEDREVRLRKRSVFRTAASGSDPQSRVAAQNRLLNDFSRDIAEEIQKLR